MVTKYLLPMASAAGLAFAIFTVYQFRQVPAAAKPYVPPPERADTWSKVVAGAGLVEANRENIPIGANIPGVVTEVFVKVGDHLAEGMPIFHTDDRNLRADLKVREANLFQAKASLDRLKAAPQTQDIPTALAAVDEARAKLNDAEVIHKRTSDLFARGMSPPSDNDRDRFALQSAKATLARVEADLNRIKTTWAKDIDVAEAQVLQAQSQLESTAIDIERCTVRALVAGQVLQVNIRPGQFAGPVWKEALVILGDVKTLNVRVDIDEQDVPYYSDQTEAYATLKGRPEARFELKRVVKTEPYVIPKKSLTGDNSERVDTRVLQVVYALPDDRPIKLYVGQQMDVYLKGAKVPDTISLKAGPEATRPFSRSETPEPKAVPAR